MNYQYEALASVKDKSVNFVSATGQESRYVRRTDDYFIIYLSSHNGCNKACRFCHLTQTGQTDMVEATVEEMALQAQRVVDHYLTKVYLKQEVPAQKIHFNFMARGEPLASSVIRKQWKQLTKRLLDIIAPTAITNVRFNISSIIPDAEWPYISDAFDTVFTGENKPIIYYSLYSLNPLFRKRWLPKAVDPAVALRKLTEWQLTSQGEVVFHWAMIEGENDSQLDIYDLKQFIKSSNIIARFNLVRYNPFSPGQGIESNAEILQLRFDELIEVMNIPGSRIVPRVGFDVAASCGMFVNKNLTNKLKDAYYCMD